MTDKKEQIAYFIQREFPQIRIVAEVVGERSATVWQAVGANDLRPGGTVSRPILMAIADVTLYVAILGEIGTVPLAVTTSLAVNSLRRPVMDRQAITECRLTEVGKALAMGEVSLFSEGDAGSIAHVVGTYSIPSVHHRRGPGRVLGGGCETLAEDSRRRRSGRPPGASQAMEAAAEVGQAVALLKDLDVLQLQ